MVFCVLYDSRGEVSGASTCRDFFGSFVCLVQGVCVSHVFFFVESAVAGRPSGGGGVRRKIASNMLQCECCMKGLSRAASAPHGMVGTTTRHDTSPRGGGGGGGDAARFSSSTAVEQ